MFKTTKDICIILRQKTLALTELLEVSNQFERAERSFVYKSVIRFFFRSVLHFLVRAHSASYKQTKSQLSVDITLSVVGQCRYTPLITAASAMESLSGSFHFALHQYHAGITLILHG